MGDSVSAQPVKIVLTLNKFQEENMNKEQKKKEYRKPQLRVVKLKQRSALLQSSTPDRLGTCFGSECDD